MASNYKLISIVFHLDSFHPPFNIIQDIEHYFCVKNCVASVNAFSGDVITCTLFGEDVISKVKSGNVLMINRKLRKYKIVETNITSICVQIDNYTITAEDVARVLRPYGTIIKSNVLNEDGTFENDVHRYQRHYFYALIDLRKDLPLQIPVRNVACNVTQVD